MNLILSLFPGIGLLDRAFEEEGFVVVRGPDLLWGGDIRTFHPPAGKFDGVTGGVPCQFFSTLANLVRANGYEPRHGNLFPEFERVVSEAAPAWFLCECVPLAPGPKVEGYAIHSFLWGNHWLGEEQMRSRRFWFGLRGREPVDLRRWLPQAALELPKATAAVCGRGSEVMVKIGGSGKVKATLTQCGRVAVTANHGGSHRPKGGHCHRYKIPEACRLQGLPEDFLAEAPFTAQGKLQVVANGVPLPLGRAIAKAVRNALVGLGGTPERKA